MQNAGQFLVQLSAFFDWFNTPGIVAVGVMLFILFKLRANYLLRLSTDITPEKFNIGLGVGSALSIVSTLLLTTTSLMFLENVVEMTGVGLNPDRAHSAGIDQKRFPSSVGGIAAKGLGVAAQNKYGLAVIVVSVLLLVIGAGYAFTVLNLGFWESFLAMSVGVGLTEELSKAAAGLLVLYMIFDTKSLSEFQFRRVVLAAFGIAGLGFGAGEALKYFGMLAHYEGANAFDYGLRAVYCVTLHGAWTLIVGGMLATSLPQDPKLLENKKIDTFYMLLLASIPTAIAHGLYNTLCFQENILALPWGGLSIFVAFRVVEAFLKENQEESKPPPLPS